MKKIAFTLVAVATLGLAACTGSNEANNVAGNEAETTGEANNDVGNAAEDQNNLNAANDALSNIAADAGNLAGQAADAAGNAAEGASNAVTNATR